MCAQHVLAVVACDGFDCESIWPTRIRSAELSKRCSESVRCVITAAASGAIAAISASAPHQLMLQRVWSESIMHLLRICMCPSRCAPPPCAPRLSSPAEMGSSQSSAAAARQAIVEAGQRDVMHLQQKHPGATHWHAEVVDFNRISSRQATGSIRITYTLPAAPRSPHSHAPASPPGEVHAIHHYVAVPRADGAKDEDTDERLWAAMRTEADASKLAATAAAIKAGTLSSSPKKGVADLSS